MDRYEREKNKALCKYSAYGMISNVIMFIGLSSLLITGLYVRYTDYYVCQEKLTMCTISESVIYSNYPKYGNRLIKSPYRETINVITSEKYPDKKYRIKCWGPYCDNNLIKNISFECYHNDVNKSPSEMCIKSNHDTEL